MNRRNFIADTTITTGALATTIGVGFAAATLPVQAQTMIKTDTDGLTAGEVSIKGADGVAVPAYRAQPAGKTGLPVVIVVQEIFGVHEHIADLCRRLAKQGYLAIAPEFYHRQGNPKTYTDIPKLQAEIVSKVPDAQVMADCDAAAAWGAANGGSDKLAITGFCWGGRIAWLYAAHNAKLKAAAPWYGRLEGAASELFPKHPVELAGALKAPVEGYYGGVDTGIKLDSVEKMNAALKAAGNKTASINVYDNSPHAFNADYRASYRKADAEDAWGKMLAFFKKNGV